MGLFGGWSIWLIEGLGGCCWVCLVDRGFGVAVVGGALGCSMVAMGG